MKFGFDKLKSMQQETAKQFKVDETLKISDVKKIAGFDVTYDGDQAVCAGVVLDAKTMKVLEVKHIVTKAPMNYVPGFLAFREGPPILQVYYDFENEPDVIMIDGHGIAHPRKCGLAAYIGVELVKPTIGVAKDLLDGEEQGDNIVIDGQIVAQKVSTRKHARPVIVSPGNLVTVDFAAELVKKTIIPPHKLPEPLHIAHKIANKVLKELRNKKK